MERQRSQEYTKKGPWTAEEDEILINFVKENGSKDWSSIRSKGLLPRTGKSCRLRWVNKLRPNLKIGCKFSAEEERVVLDLQAKFGNKWATIATYLHGRTDNDVKNFWSTRQKRLARMLRSSNNKHKTKISASNDASSSQPPKSSSNKVSQESSSNYHLSSSCFCLENSNTTKYMMPKPISSLPLLVDVDVQITPPAPLPSEFSGHSLSQQLEGVGTSSFQEIDFMEFSAPNFMEAFQGNHELEMIDFGMSMEKLDDVAAGRREVYDNNMFGDLPVDWFDLPESVPKSSEN